MPGLITSLQNTIITSTWTVSQPQPPAGTVRQDSEYDDGFSLGHYEEIVHPEAAHGNVDSRSSLPHEYLRMSFPGSDVQSSCMYNKEHMRRVPRVDVNVSPSRVVYENSIQRH